ncbi:hypothetical protein B0H14DRAFT_2628821 [Mycena olivaceomarginata]|nr:hypothetical protein B0H14DRAFT_2628821 [Mycena olivaceomarginata]
MSSHRFIAPQMVAQAVAIPPLLFVLLENFRSAEERWPTSRASFDLSHMFIRSAIPSTVCGPDDMPFGRTAELEKYVVAYLERAALLYAILFEVSRRTGQSMKLDPSVYWCLSQAITFNYFLGKPTYGYVPDVPSWSRSRISTLESPQLINNWACENTLLEDGIEQTQNFGRALEQSAMYADMGYGPNPSSRYFV